MANHIHIAKYIKLLCFGFLCFGALLFIQPLKAQSPYYYHITEENGLPSSEVYQVIQDKFGYIWIGCDAGLYRYDGVRFKAYTCSQQNSKSISGLRIDRDGKLWCQNFSGQIYVVTGDSLRLFSDLSKRVSAYQQFTIDFKNRIWIANSKAIELYNHQGKLLGSYYKLNSKKDTAVWNEIEIDSRGELYATALNAGIASIKYNANNCSINFIDTTSILKNRTSFEALNDGLISLTEVNPLRRYVLTEVKNKRVIYKNHFLPFVENGTIYKVYKDNFNRNWVCTSSGIALLNEEYKVDKLTEFFLKDDKISGIFQDREGNLWISSLQNGLYVVPDYDLKIYTQQNSTLKDHNITALYVSEKNKFFVGTFSGMIYELKDDEKLSQLELPQNMFYRTVKRFVESNGLIFSAHGPLSLINEKSSVGNYKLFNARDFTWLGDTLFLAMPNGLVFIPEFKLSSVINYGKVQNVLHPKSSKAVVTDKKNGVIYFASIDGLYQYFNGKVSQLKVDGESVFANKLSIIDDDLWVGTVNNGICIFSNGILKSKISDKNLLKGKTVKCFYKSKKRLWVATELGLNCIDLNEKKAKLYSHTDGIVTKEINDITVWNGNLYLATNKGLYKFREEENNTLKTINPNIELTDIKVNDASLKSPYNTNFSFSENSITFKFNTACFKARGNYKYQYRLLGLDTNWRFNPSLENEITYAALPSGSFTFQVYAVNEKDVKSFMPQEFKFIINKPIWQQWWFYLIAFLLSLALIVFIASLIIKNIKRKAKIKNELISSQLTAIRAQMNPHFMYNTLNSIQDLILKNEIKNTNYYLSKFSNLMRKILEFSETEKIVLDEEIEMLNSYLELEKLRFGDDFKFRVEVDENIDIYKTYIPSLIIQPFVENAIKHGLLHKKGIKELLLNFKRDLNYIIVTIDDNGVGRKRSHEIKQKSQIQHKSFATEATQKRIDLLNDNYREKIEIEIIDKIDVNTVLGTKIIIRFPIENCNS